MLSYIFGTLVLFSHQIFLIMTFEACAARYLHMRESFQIFKRSFVLWFRVLNIQPI